MEGKGYAGFVDTSEGTGAQTGTTVQMTPLIERTRGRSSAY